MNQPPLRSRRSFFGTRPRPCPYLDGLVERKVVAELPASGARAPFERLSRAGFRRSRRYVYRPACPGCDACVPVRIVAPEFAATRSQRRVEKRNADLGVADLPAAATAEQYRLFSGYQRRRHGDGDMSLMTFADYRAMVEDSPVESRALEFRYPDGSLAAVMLMDRMEDALSAVYSFFDPEAGGRGLGTYMILWMARRARALGLRHVYLGYWIAGSPKMAYKARFRPLEALDGDGWRPLADEDASARAGSPPARPRP